MSQSLKNYTIAFVGWNPFQFLHIKHLAQQLPNTVFVLEQRSNNNVKFFSHEILYNNEIPIIIIPQNMMHTIDGTYDIIITQTLFTDIHTITRSKLVMLQYGYAKEPHNYGTWRALASLCLTYGQYASQKIAPYCPIAVTGNPRFALWHDQQFHIKAKNSYTKQIDPNKKTILYMPTWGDLSSFDLYIEAILSLSDIYNILIKLHHNTDFLETKRVSTLNKKNIHFLGANDDSLELISVCDLVISDYSGAIFDALYCDKAIVLLDLPDAILHKSRKIDKYSLEFTQRDTIGIRVSSPRQLYHTVNAALNNTSDIIQKASILKQQLFIPGNCATELTVTALEKLMDNGYPRTQSQEYIRETVIACYGDKCFSDKIRLMIINSYKYIASYFRFG